MHQNRWVLPAIQREFVWSDLQICRLFDSMMRGYPFGTFLFWQIEAETASKFRFYEFMRRYHDRDTKNCRELPSIGERQVTAVLDGQQRLTALNIGLSGSRAMKLPNKRLKRPSLPRDLSLPRPSGGNERPGRRDGVRLPLPYA
jgi:hypothetical protein